MTVIRSFRLSNEKFFKLAPLLAKLSSSLYSIIHLLLFLLLLLLQLFFTGSILEIEYSASIEIYRRRKQNSTSLNRCVLYRP